MSIRLRKAVMLDSENLLRWKNDPTMRKFSIVSHDEINPVDHMKWLEKHLDEILIIEDNDNAYGDIRLEGDMVAIKLAPEHRGKGIGSWAIREIQKSREYLTALIVDGNVPSMNLFVGCGFEVVGRNENYSILEWRK